MYIAFLWMEAHGPMFLPYSEGIKIFLQLFLVLFVFNDVTAQARVSSANRRIFESVLVHSHCTVISLFI